MTDTRPASSLTHTARAGAAWTLVSTSGRRVTMLVTGVILARLLAPSDFGLVAMALVFISFAELVRDMGTGAGIVQTPQPSDVLLSSLFWLNLALGVVATALLMAVAWPAASLLREPRLGPVLQVLAISPFVSSISVVQSNLLLRHLEYRRLAITEVTGAVIGGVAGVILAVRGYGVWSLVCQSLLGAGAMSAGMWAASRWRPAAVFDMKSIRVVLGFSANLTGFNVLNFVARNADNFLIGRYLGAQSLGYYDLAYRLMLSSLQLLSGAFTRSLYPVYARMQGDYRRLGAAYLKVMSLTALIAFPAMFGLAATAGPLVQVLFGPRWTPAVPLILILAPVGALQAIGATVGNIYQVTGRTDLLVRWSAAAGAIIIVAFAIGLRWGVIGVAACYAVATGVLAYPLFEIPLSLIDVPVSALVRVVRQPLFCSLTMLVVLIAVGRILPDELGNVGRLLALVPTGIAAYLAATWLHNRDGLMQLASLSKRAVSQG